MKESAINMLSPSARQAMKSLAGTVEDAAKFNNQIADVLAALKVGHEVMEIAAREQQKIGNAFNAKSAMLGASYVLGVASALECTTRLIRDMHPDAFDVKNIAKNDEAPTPNDPGPPPDPTNRLNGKMDLG